MKIRYAFTFAIALAFMTVAATPQAFAKHGDSGKHHSADSSKKDSSKKEGSKKDSSTGDKRKGAKKAED